jgi:hypothetical protein
VASGGFAARRLVRKTVSMQALEAMARAITGAAWKIRPRVQLLATHSRATRSRRNASFDLKSDAAEST